jgi:hypothetical protein
LENEQFFKGAWEEFQGFLYGEIGTYGTADPIRGGKLGLGRGLPLDSYREHYCILTDPAISVFDLFFAVETFP